MVATGEVILVLGGTRSGKSAVAEELVSAGRLPVTYVATGVAPDDRDPEWLERVSAHRLRRPQTWETHEVAAGADLAAALRAIDGAALVDSLGTWVAGLGSLAGDGADGPSDELSVGHPDELCAALDERRRTGLRTVVVSEEVGLGVHPATEVGRRFADILGDLNRSVASVADRVLLVVAGRVLELGAALPDALPDAQRTAQRAARQ